MSLFKCFCPFAEFLLWVLFCDSSSSFLRRRATPRPPFPSSFRRKRFLLCFFFRLFILCRLGRFGGFWVMCLSCTPPSPRDLFAPFPPVYLAQAFFVSFRLFIPSSLALHLVTPVPAQYALFRSLCSALMTASWAITVPFYTTPGSVQAAKLLLSCILFAHHVLLLSSV